MCRHQRVSEEEDSNGSLKRIIVLKKFMRARPQGACLFGLCVPLALVPFSTFLAAASMNELVTQSHGT